MTRLGFVINLDSCADSRGCMVACKAKTASFIGSHFIETHTAIGGEYPHPNTYFVPVLCRHCENPSCVAACPKDVLMKDPQTGIVAVGDVSMCESCEDKPCVAACPLGNIDLDPVTGRIGKCDMCADRLAQGLPPACFVSCLTRSIMFGDLEDPDDQAAQLLEMGKAAGIVHTFDAGDNGSSAVHYLMSRHEWQGTEGLYSPAWKNC